MKDDFSDRLHERRMQEAMSAYLASKDEVERARLWAIYAELHRQRSPEKIKRMEAEKGLL